MRRRRVVNVTAGAIRVMLLALAAAAVVLWVRSYFVADAVSVNRKTPAPGSTTLWSSGGSLGLYQWDMPGGSDVVVSPLGWFYRNGPAPSADKSRFLDDRPGVSRFAGIAYLNYTYSNPGRLLQGMHERAVVLPYWLIVALLGAWPAARGISFRRRRRAARLAAGLCGECGYDLRATPGRCPECGRLAPEIRSTGA